MARSPTVLITGGAGYIGSHAVLASLAAGWNVVVLDDLSQGFRQSVPAGAALVVGDVGDAACVTRVLADHDVSAIMHFAGSIVVPESVANPGHYYHNNTAKSLVLLRAAAAQRLIGSMQSSRLSAVSAPIAPPVVRPM